MAPELRSFIESVPDGSIISFAPEGCYRIETAIDVVGRHDLTFVGQGATLKATTISDDPNRRQWNFQSGGGFRLCDMRVEGVNTEYTPYPGSEYDPEHEWEHNYSFRGVQGAVLDNVEGLHAYGDNIAIAPDTSGAYPYVPSRDITVRDSRFDLCGRHGVAITHAENVTIDGNSFDRIGYQLVDLEIEAEVWFGRNIAFTNNTIGTLRFSVLASASGWMDSSNVRITGNEMTEFPQTCAAPVFLGQSHDSRCHLRRDFVIEDNRFKTLAAGIYGSCVNELSVRSNIVEFMNGGCQPEYYPMGAQYGAHLEAAHDGIVTANEFVGATAAAYRHDDVSGFSICANKLTEEGDFDQPTPCE